MEAVGLDEFGREHFVVEAAPGRLCMTLGETEAGAVIVRGHKDLTPEMLSAWDDVDRKRMLLLRQTVAVGDRLVAIEGENVVHCSLCEISARLGKLAAKTRRLTFARYHPSHYDCKKYDVEKLVLVHAPKGPLGLLISEVWHHGAVVDGFQPLPNGSVSKLARDPRIHRGCCIVNVNGLDVSDFSRDRVIQALAALKDEEKELIIYRAAPASCDKLLQVEHNAPDASQGVVFGESENCKCVVTATTTPAMATSLLPGDVLVSVNGVDVSWMRRIDALAVLSTAAFPRVLHFYRLRPVDHPECHQLHIESGPLGLHLDSSQPHCAVITGFKNAADAEQPAFASCATFVPGSRIIAINKLCVVQHSLADITAMLAKLKNAPKDILLANEPLVSALQKRQSLVCVSVAKGPLGVHFDSARPDEARVSGFYAMPDGQQGPIERCGRVTIGALLWSINDMNVSCLTLAQVTELLKKLSDAPKDLGFHVQDAARDASTKVVHVRVPSGPLGIGLKSSISNKVIVDRLIQDPALGSTFLFDHGGVIPGSQVLAVDGFSVSSLELSEVTQLLRMLVDYEKTITFSTTAAAYAEMMSASHSANRRSVVVTHSPMGVTFDPSRTQRAVICAYDATATELNERSVPIGSRLVAIDDVDLRALDVKQITRVLKDLAGVPKTLVFDIATDVPSAPPSPNRVRFDVSDDAPNSSASPPQSPLQRRDTTGAVVDSGAPPSPPQRGLSMPLVPAPAATPAPLQLASLSIKPLEVLKSMPLADSSKTLDQKPQQCQQQHAASATPKTEYMINMASWTGSRSLFRLTVDIASSSLQIVSAKGLASPRAGGKSGGTTVLFSEIASLDFGKKSESTGGGGAPVVIGVAKSKKPLELDMRSREERQELCALLATLAPALMSHD